MEKNDCIYLSSVLLKSYIGSVTFMFHDVSIDSFIANKFTFKVPRKSSEKYCTLTAEFSPSKYPAKDITLFIRLMQIPIELLLSEYIDGSKVVRIYRDLESVYGLVAVTEDDRVWWIYEEPEVDYSEWMPLKIA